MLKPFQSFILILKLFETSVVLSETLLDVFELLWNYLRTFEAVVELVGANLETVFKHLANLTYLKQFNTGLKYVETL